ncbi:MAG: beta-lactamase family protein [Aquiluna sp.]|nr:beta-lactamase family protein [Aquiluna sp.]MCF8546176.1 beta-lactamase family protein [Aquiluna sp.]
MNLESTLQREFAGDNWNVNVARYSNELEVASIGDTKAFDMIASVTKIYTAAIYLRLEELGEISLDDPVGRWLPEEARQLSFAKSQGVLSLRHLLSHKSGIPNYYKNLALTKKHTEAQISDDPGWNFETAMELARKGKSKPFPTKRAHYSFTNYQLLDRILEQVAGGFESSLRELITRPLDLRETWLLTKNNLQDFDKTTQLHFGDISYLGSRRLASLGAEGGLIASQTDVARFLSALFQDQVITNAMGKMLEETSALFPGVRYGLGLMKFSKFVSGKDGVVGHLGATGSLAAYDPNTGTSVALATNQFKAGQKSLRALRLLLK